MITKTETQVKKFLDIQKKLGGVVPSNLPDGATAYIETNRFIYKFTKDGTKLVVDSAAKCVQQSVDRVLDAIDSHSVPLKHDMEDWIGLGMRMILRFSSGTSIMVEEVRGASIIGPNDSYDYKLWEQNDDTRDKDTTKRTN